jgi:hypothetical protein
MFQGNNVDVGTPSAGTVGTTELSASGTASATTFLRGDNSWVVPTDTTKLPLAGGTMTGQLIAPSVRTSGSVSGDFNTIINSTNAYGLGVISTGTTSSHDILRLTGGSGLVLTVFGDKSAVFTGKVTVKSAVGTLTTDNDGSFDMSASNNFKCTPAGNFTLTFTNIVSQSGFILLVNTGGHTVSAHTNSKVDANLLATVTAAGTYLVSYFSDGTNVYLTNSAIYT